MKIWHVLCHPALNITSQPSPFMSFIISKYHGHTSPPEPVQTLIHHTQLCAKATHFHPHKSHPRPFIMLSHLPLSSLSLFPLYFFPLSLLWFLTNLNRLRSPCPSKELCSLYPTNLPPIYFFPLSSCVILVSYYRPYVILFLLTFSLHPRCAMAPKLHQCNICGCQRGALLGRHHHGEDNHLDSIDGSSFNTFSYQCLSLE